MAYKRTRAITAPSVASIITFINVQKVAGASTVHRASFLSCLVRISLKTAHLAVILVMILEELLQQFDDGPVSRETALVHILMCVVDLPVTELVGVIV